MVLCWFQSLGMLNFIEFPFFEPLNNFIQSFSSFMFVTMIQKAFKGEQSSL
jgi:hypothetical protein